MLPLELKILESQKGIAVHREWKWENKLSDFSWMLLSSLEEEMIN